jgi:alkylation response protein AidB-like acyl-CoA dehydrogenase
MLTYDAPINDLMFLLDDWLGLRRHGIARDELTAILDAAGRFAAEVLLPLNAVGDQQGCRLKDGNVTTPDGFPAAYRAWVDQGWPTLTVPEAQGGQGLPVALGFAVSEMMQSANLSFSDYLNGADAAHLLAVYGTPDLQARYIGPLVAGEWAVTQCMTEPQGGSDLGLLQTRATPLDDGTYQLSGTKIFISGGDQDLTDNIVHLVMARLQDAPAGTKGLSLFLVPKFLPPSDGGLGPRNGAKVTRLEKKMGYAGSATCEVQFDGATGWIVGPPNTGLQSMFLMVAFGGPTGRGAS